MAPVATIVRILTYSGPEGAREEDDSPVVREVGLEIIIDGDDRDVVQRALVHQIAEEFAAKPSKQTWFNVEVASAQETHDGDLKFWRATIKGKAEMWNVHYIGRQ